MNKFFQPKRLLFFSAQVDSQKQPEQVVEGEKKPDQNLSEEQQKLNQRVEAAKKTANDYLKDANPGVQDAAKEALRRLQSLDQTGTLDQKTIDAELSQINHIFEFFELSNKFEDQKKLLLKNRTESLTAKGESLKAIHSNLLQNHPELNRFSNATILLRQLEEKYLAESQKSVNISLTADKLSLTDYLQNPASVISATTEINSALTFDRTFEQFHDAQLINMDAEANSLAIQYLSNLLPEAKSYVGTESSLLRAKLESTDIMKKDDFMNQLNQAEEQANLQLDLVSHTGEEGKRALIIANFKDQLNSIQDRVFNGAKGIKEASQVLDLTAKKIGYKPEQVEKLFSTQKINYEAMPEADTKKSYKILGDAVSLRTENGLQLATIPKDQQVTLIDAGIYTLENAYKTLSSGQTGDAYQYYKVKLEPQGIIGLVEAKQVNLARTTRVGTTVIDRNKPLS